jgi:hypothetical protein
MAHPKTEDVVVVTKTEFEKVWSRPAAVASGEPWVLVKDYPKATKEQIAAAAFAAGVEVPDDGKVTKEQLVTHISEAAGSPDGED